MARVVFNANDIDQEFQIEDGIRRTLETNSVASVAQSVIEQCYELKSDEGEITDGSIHDKCRQIAERSNLDFSLHEELVIFRRRPK
jgi:hypothetical protein